MSSPPEKKGEKPNRSGSKPKQPCGSTGHGGSGWAPPRRQTNIPLLAFYDPSSVVSHHQSNCVCSRPSVRVRMVTVFLRHKRIPGAIQFRPITTLGEVMAAKPGDPVPEPTETMIQPTVKEIADRCREMIEQHDAAKKIDGKTAFGPEGPPVKKDEDGGQK
ncbi:hypothetical protein BAUCODRAFT_146404 [Baudoinia panamericana UAMH 10762]|uniref:Uncharacterized protein n=1 Tax=Baudoinia panamericana (strain UAMH 10762) TaxID=717646 RepID=M2N1G6_BAUPA|nr:uncharacterized protein BAUCODRAFT_146404 [Baudoinia panamericana UAMH 10762]EMC97783.1 hypothetical protein BAUCODRAFT_146404 [Baudoinia panamericana UAMH 10762]